MWKLRKIDRNIDFSRKTKKKRSGVNFGHLKAKRKEELFRKCHLQKLNWWLWRFEGWQSKSRPFCWLRRRPSLVRRGSIRPRPIVDPRSSWSSSKVAGVGGARLCGALLRSRPWARRDRVRLESTGMKVGAKRRRGKTKNCLVNITIYFYCNVPACQKHWSQLQEDHVLQELRRFLLHLLRCP